MRCVSVVLIALAIAHDVSVSTALAQERRVLRVAEGPLDAALAELADEADLTIVAPATLTSDKTTAEIACVCAPSEALERLLSPHGLAVRQASAGAWVVIEAPEAAHVVGPDRRRFQGSAPPRYETIRVTAQRRAQPLLDVPISLSVVPGSEIEAERLLDLERVGDRTPGFLVQRQTDSSPSFVIRGIEAAASGALSEPSVSVFIDGFDASRLRGSGVELLDLERLEIARGPQGTLYGRGAQIGAVSIVTHRPVLGENTARAEVLAGEDDLRGATVVLNASPHPERFALRASIRRREQAPTVANIAADGIPANDDDLFAGRLSARWRPAETLLVDFVFNHQLDRDAPVVTKAIGLASPDGDRDPFSDAAQQTGRVSPRREINRGQLIAQWERGDWRIEAMAGHRRVDFDNSFDADGTAFDFLELVERHDQNAQMGEFELEWSRDEQLTLSLGGSLFRDETTEWLEFSLNEQRLAAGFPEVLDLVKTIDLDGDAVALSRQALSLSQTAGDRRSSSVFANIGWRLTQRLTFDAGLRVTHDRASAAVTSGAASRDSVPPGLFPNGLLGDTRGQAITAKRTETFASPRIAVLYDLGDDSRLYASLARGVRAGYPQFHIRNPGGGGLDVERDDVERERVTSLEGGYKGRLTSDLYVEGTVFGYRYTDFQTLSNEIGEGVVNAGEAGAWGLELLADAQITSSLKLDFSYALLSSRYDDFTDQVLGEPIDLSGNRFRLAPRHTVFAGVEHRQPLNSTLEQYGRAGYAWRSSYYFNSDNLPDERQGAFGLLDLRLGLGRKDGAWSAELFAENALDTEWLRDVGNTGKIFGVPTAIPGRGRLIGIRIIGAIGG